MKKLIGAASSLALVVSVAVLPFVTSAAGNVHLPTNKDQCKNGGFAHFTDRSGNVFRNQGQCVSFVERQSNQNNREHNNQNNEEHDDQNNRS